MYNQKIEITIQFVKETLKNAESGHDWWHIARVFENTKRILGDFPKANVETCFFAALLHDIADSKFHNGDEDIGPAKASRFLQSIDIEQNIIDQVVFIIKNISFKGGHNDTIEKPIELQIVQDADRLDAIGAIGIARVFNFGGYKGNPIYDPNIKAEIGMTKEVYKKSKGTSINHFYEKLLLLSDKMNTETGKKLALERHNFMMTYLDQFYKEWGEVS